MNDSDLWGLQNYDWMLYLDGRAYHVALPQALRDARLMQLYADSQRETAYAERIAMMVRHILKTRYGRDADSNVPWDMRHYALCLYKNVVEAECYARRTKQSGERATATFLKSIDQICERIHPFRVIPSSPTPPAPPRWQTVDLPNGGEDEYTKAVRQSRVVHAEWLRRSQMAERSR